MISPNKPIASDRDNQQPNAGMVNSPWHLGLLAWSAAILSLSDAGVDGDVGAERLEVAADLADAAGLLIVPAGAEAGEPLEHCEVPREFDRR
jgi:hypothetical protein